VAAVTADDPGVAAFNRLPPGTATARLVACNGATGWAAVVEGGRPYADRSEIRVAAEQASAALRAVDVQVALDGHPRIGQRPGTGSQWSQDEQSGVRRDESTLAAVAQGNRDYEQRFGHLYLVCATGLDAEQMLADLRARLGNDDETEQRVVASELAKIAQLRVERLLDELGSESHS